jgi:(p)ppGpp synthase/HD superfamily hydrolase
VLVDDLVTAARAYAQDLHAGDVRKGSGVPYFEGHLEPVAEIVRSAGGDEVQVAAAYLHDAAEDHGGQARLEDIATHFGPDVAAIVEHLSDSLVDTEAGEEKAPWDERKSAYVAALAHRPARSLEVAAADKLHNASALLADLERLGGDVWARFTVTDPAKHVWYHRALLDVLAGRLGAHPTVTALRQVVDRLDAAVTVSARG